MQFKGFTALKAVKSFMTILELKDQVIGKNIYEAKQLAIENGLFIQVQSKNGIRLPQSTTPHIKRLDVKIDSSNEITEALYLYE
jgi:hypothetical protein